MKNKMFFFLKKSASTSAASRNTKEQLIALLFGVSSMITLVLLSGIFVFLLASSFGFFRSVSLKEFLFATDWNPSSYRAPSWGILSSVTGTIMITTLSLVIAIPFGICIAIYLLEIAHERTREVLKPTVELIASIP